MSNFEPVPGPSAMPLMLTTVPMPNPGPLPITPVQNGAPLTILKMLHEKVKNLPKSVPIAKKTGPLAAYCCASAELTKDIITNVEVWETWDQKLNVLISHNILNIHPLVTRGKYGLIGLVWLLECLVLDCKVNEGLFDGNVGWEAINRHLHFITTLFIPLLTTPFFSVCKQQDLPKDVAPVNLEISHDSVLPVTKKPAGKPTKGGRGSWNPPDVISVKISGKIFRILLRLLIFVVF